MECAHCGDRLLGRHWRFCDSRCRQAAYRRRRAGLPEDALAGGGRRGRVPLAGKTRTEFASALDEIRLELEGMTAVLAARDLAEANQHLADAVDRLEALDRADAQNIAEQDGRLEPGTDSA